MIARHQPTVEKNVIHLDQKKKVRNVTKKDVQVGVADNCLAFTLSDL